METLLYSMNTVQDISEQMESLNKERMENSDSAKNIICFLIKNKRVSHLMLFELLETLIFLKYVKYKSQLLDWF